MAGGQVRWGILGTGLIARGFARDLVLSESGVVTAVGSRSPKGAERFAAEFGVEHPHPGYESLVEDPEVDVVYVATPHPMHRDNAILALRAGKPVLVEKPLAMNAAQATEIVDVAREISSASMVLGAPNRIVALSDPAFTGVDAQTSMLLGYESGAHAVLTCTLRGPQPDAGIDRGD
jgi:predicted dinucleotide-binding enzyme